MRYECLRCGHVWEGRAKKVLVEGMKNGNKVMRREFINTKPKTCPNRLCHSPYWDRSRKERDDAER